MPASRNRTAPFDKSRVELRLYCHGLGDCHLVGLPADDGTTAWVMIDCGIHTSMPGGPGLVAAVAKDVESVTGGKLLAIAGTHEHWDHNSGFHPSAKLFNHFEVGNVWFAWTENPADKQGQQLDKFKEEAVDTLALAQAKMPKSPEYVALGAAIGSILGFFGRDDQMFGIKGQESRAARNNLRVLSKSQPPAYLEPGEVINIPGVSKVRCYVLGPPRDAKLLRLLDSDALTYRLDGVDPVLSALRSSLEKRAPEDDPQSPFDGDEGEDFSAVREKTAFLIDHYANEPSRTIDHDWMQSACDLALQLDSKTNNTSLVLAFEIIDSGHVLLFAADAQVGNWSSWEHVKFPAAPGRPAVTGAELLSRTVFYKVGHHGSRNATASKGGLELMTRLEVAFNPTNEVMAKNVHWNDIPAIKLNEELERRTNRRLIQSDRDWIGDSSQPIPIAKGGALVDVRRETGPSIVCVFE